MPLLVLAQLIGHSDKRPILTLHDLDAGYGETAANVGAGKGQDAPFLLFGILSVF